MSNTSNAPTCIVKVVGTHYEEAVELLYDVVASKTISISVGTGDVEQKKIAILKI